MKFVGATRLLLAQGNWRPTPLIVPELASYKKQSPGLLSRMGNRAAVANSVRGVKKAVPEEFHCHAALVEPSATRSSPGQGHPEDRERAESSVNKTGVDTQPNLLCLRTWSELKEYAPSTPWSGSEDTLVGPLKAWRTV
ncbi:hypothetical protein DPEC_G00134400 [Dallia pectoralis]|uniref:Uncharacterized protein n=1 Tax=Dallia pectoralis TaxID=75939 RepID=A0ACC2GRH3_DALPE|nr:hypothetical protein DPEC_G00134400 [Dallia pectoralis]